MIKKENCCLKVISKRKIRKEEAPLAEGKVVEGFSIIEGTPKENRRKIGNVKEKKRSWKEKEKWEAPNRKRNTI